MSRILELKTVRPPIGAIDAIEARMVALFRRELYLPLMAELDDHGEVLRNSYEDLLRAIASGRIQWVDGHIEGRIDADLSRELRAAGATWDRAKKRWKLPAEILTPDMRMAMGQASSTFKRAVQKLDDALTAISPEALAGQLKLGKIFDTALFRMDRSLSESIRDITVTPTIRPEERATIAEKYTTDMQRYIKTWTEEQIKTLRERVQKESVSGARYESLAQIIQTSYGQSRNKAAFLARQETNLFLSEFKQTRYERAGVDSYIWHCVAGSPNHPVRPGHKVLNGTLQKWNAPPVTNPKTGARNHPGCEFGCRCYDRPVVVF